MTCAFLATTSQPSDLDATVRAVGNDPGSIEEAGLSPDLCRLRRFRGTAGQILVTVRADGVLDVVVGVGPRSGLGREILRRAGAAVARELAGCRVVVFDTAGLSGPGLEAELVARSIVEGASLALDRFDVYRSAPEELPLIERFVLLGSGPDVETGVERGCSVASAVALARSLGNTPAGDCTPSAFAAHAVALGAEEGLEVVVLDEVDALRERLGGLLGVASGSAEPARLVRLVYSPEHGGDDLPTVALVGKGITFDSGGLSLKSPSSMVTMKTDMSGAAAVLATLGACKRLRIAVRVVAFMALTENMPGGRAVKPGDVLTIRNGKTIEVLNTDAEGRLVLADALSLAVEERPDAIVDVATLTGACVVALGRSIAGRMGNDDRLLAALGEAGRQAGEISWHLPLPTRYKKLFDSEVADMNNQGVPGQAGALVAGLLLEEFVGDVPWAHLDIAGPARSEEDSGYLHKGATGFGVRTLIELLEHYQPLGGTAVADPSNQAVPA